MQLLSIYTVQLGGATGFLPALAQSTQQRQGCTWLLMNSRVRSPALAAAAAAGGRRRGTHFSSFFPSFLSRKSEHHLDRFISQMSDGGAPWAPPRRGPPGAWRAADDAPRWFQRRLS